MHQLVAYACMLIVSRKGVQQCVVCSISSESTTYTPQQTVCQYAPRKSATARAQGAHVSEHYAWHSFLYSMWYTLFNSTRVDEERKSSIILAIKMKACAVVGRREEGPLCDPASELLLGRSARVVR